ncbi:hypothetical protein M8J76_007513 [Diaphorina citri]|nr:hypothetical protein M8J75_010306 [Diaphorina citri]KAI5745029.1 hypothetical protein M8J76_007513 [Diaphorina citri]KAI5752287.1 hypothetical protein M8J77_015581 [Diaphorina citri]
MAQGFPDDVLGKKWDKCVYDLLVKVGGGLAVGGVGSLFLFKRKAWPLLVGSGFGIGLAYGNCEKEISQSLSVSANKKTLI